MVVLVTGGSGQLGQALQSIVTKFSKFSFHFVDSDDCDITDVDVIHNTFSKYKPDFCINAAAYTAVDKAESEVELATSINVEGARNLAVVCKEFDTILFHISTDFVFDGQKRTPYTQMDQPNPQSVYGQTKLDGEKAIEEHWHKHIIIRTSWLYSAFANNFMKTMLRLASERDSLSVVDDQIGTPTNAVDLANAIITIIEVIAHSSSTYNLQPTTYNPQLTTYNLQPPTSNPHLTTDNSQLTPDIFGTYHFSNDGQCSWFDFAKKIFEINNIAIDLKPIPTSAFPTAAERPKYSVLDKSKIKSVFGVEVRTWEESLKISSKQL